MEWIGNFIPRSDLCPWYFPVPTDGQRLENEAHAPVDIFFPVPWQWGPQCVPNGWPWRLRQHCPLCLLLFVRTSWVPEAGEPFCFVFSPVFDMWESKAQKDSTLCQKPHGSRYGFSSCLWAWLSFGQGYRPSRIIPQKSCLWSVCYNLGWLLRYFLCVHLLSLCQWSSHDLKISLFQVTLTMTFLVL